MFVDMTQLYLDPPVSGAVDFFKRLGQAMLDGVVVTRRKVLSKDSVSILGRGVRGVSSSTGNAR